MSGCSTSSTASQFGDSIGEDDDAFSDLRPPPDSVTQAEVGTGVALFELSPVFVSSPSHGADLVAAHHYGDSQQLLVVISAGRLWLNYQVARCQPYVKSFALPGPDSCAALALAPDGTRMALIGTESVHFVDIDQAIRLPQIEFECFRLGAAVKPQASCWFRDDAGRDQLVLARDRGGTLVLDPDLVTQDELDIDVEVAEIQAAHGLVDYGRLLLKAVNGAYYWLDGQQLIGLARFRSGVRIQLQTHNREGPVWSVYTPSRSILELFGLELKGVPISTHIVPESYQHFLFDNYIFCISTDKIEIVSLVLSDVNFEFGANFDVALSIMQTIPTSEPISAYVVGNYFPRALQDQPPLLTWSSSAVRRVFRSSTIIDLVEIVVSAFINRASDTPLPSPEQISLLALSLRLDPTDFFEFAGDRAWNVERNFPVAFEFYNRSNLAFHKLVRLCMDASRHCDIVQIVDDVLAKRTSLSDKNRCELAHCQFFCLLYAYVESHDDTKLLEFARRSKHLNVRRALDSLRTTNDHDLMLRFCCEHDLVIEYLSIRAESSGCPLSTAEVDFLIERGHREQLLSHQAVFLALSVEDQLRLIMADVDTVPDSLWPALLLLPFRISPSSLLSLFRHLSPRHPMLSLYILSALQLLDTSPGHLDQDVFIQRLREWRSEVDYQKLIEICLAQLPALTMGAALLLECNQDLCEAAFTRLTAASEDFAHDAFVDLLMAELRKLQSAEEKSLVMLMAQQIWQQKSTVPFESAIIPFVAELAPVILSQPPSPWVTSRLFLEALASSPDLKVFERDDYEGGLQRVLASPELLRMLTESRSETFTFRHDSPSLPLYVPPCGRRRHHTP